ncbi:hypothetical protein V5O48_016106 [Marasmius crinis-equi]|uniref:Mid2 domain-containing protein n=1 Tax=Marasmius crinis-equi TaxID=585013 RepID=A0ABR3ESL9_9AGAR
MVSVGHVFGLGFYVVLHLLASGKLNSVRLSILNTLEPYYLSLLQLQSPPAWQAIAQSDYQITTTITATLYDVTNKPNSGSAGSGNGATSQNWSRTLVPVGTASDGTATTFSEEIVEFGVSTDATGAATTFTTSTIKATRIQSDSGYVRSQIGTDSAGGFTSVQTCSYVSESLGGCVDVVQLVQTTTQTESGGAVATTIITTSGTLQPSDAELVPVTTIAITSTSLLSSTASSPSPTSSDEPGLANQNKGKNNVVGPAVGAAVGGFVLILLLLGLYWLCRRRQHKAKSQSEIGSRGLIASGIRAGNHGGDSVLDGDSEYKYHYRTSRMPSMADSSREKDALSINSSSPSYTNSHYISPYPRSPTHSPSNSTAVNLSTPNLPFKAPHFASSPLSTPPIHPDEAESLPPHSTIDTVLSGSTLEPIPSRQGTADSALSSGSTDSHRHPGHGFRIHPSRFIERLSLSSTYLEALTGGKHDKGQENTGQGPEVLSDEPVDLEAAEEPAPGPSSTSTHSPTSQSHSDPHDHPPSSPPSPSPPPSTHSFSPPRPAFAAHKTHASSTSSLPLPSISRTVDPHSHPHSASNSPITPSFAPSAFPTSSTPRSWATPSPFSYQSFQTASEGHEGDRDEASTIEEPARTPSPQYGFAV